MIKQLGIYPDIGSKARDLLYKNYTRQPSIHYHYGCFDWSFHLLCQINDIVPGLGTGFRFSLPFQRSNRVELQYLHDFIGITAGIGLTSKPLLHFSGVVGESLFSIGTDLSFDSATGKFAKCNAGFSFNSSILIASLTLNDMADSVIASCYHPVNPLTNSAIAAEVRHRFLSNETTLAFGAQHAVFPFTLVKARVDTNGKLGALIQQELLDTFFLTLDGQVDVKAVTRSAKLGLSVAFMH
ncbi:unnamed protein product [Ilex paraguariensis]|uniref:Uncharacterized protein n=1 Tax=Ilex paraguariensis TaxID=185542 RepID=A0ABC8URI0_9AQUA